MQSRGMRIEMPRALSDKVLLVANPIRMSESPVQYLRHPPALGEHTDEVLGSWLAMSGADVAGLRLKKIV